MVVAAGGDGTLNAVLQGLVGTELPLGIIPRGTANVLAGTLRLPSGLSEACQVIGQANHRQVDVGQVNGIYFFNVASVGLSVAKERMLTHAAKRRLGLLVYPITVLRALRQARPFRVAIRARDRTIHTSAIQVSVANGRFYAGTIKVTGESELDDARLDLTSIEIEHWWQLFGLLPLLRSGPGLDCDELRCLQGAAFEVRTARRRTVDTDGELTTHTPAVFRVVPRAIKVCVPLG